MSKTADIADNWKQCTAMVKSVAVMLCRFLEGVVFMAMFMEHISTGLTVCSQCWSAGDVSKAGILDLSWKYVLLMSIKTLTSISFR